MTKKFTEEQYQKIVNLQEDEYRFSILEGNDDCDYSFWRRLINAEPDIASFANENKLIDELAALANPLTREWAHDQFVEKEQKFLFTKIKEVHGKILSLNQSENDRMIYLDIDGPTPLTIKQAEEYGYNLDAFTKTPYEHGVSEEDDDLPF